ncbi:MAG TPA: hypothetical protein VNQ77_19535 [Frankiaceae bacterium]|nr:hypothetical protein [Frankiaceae bacterium]
MRDFDDDIYGRADALRRAVDTVSGPRFVGVPFGPGFGLATVVRWTCAIVPDPLELRPIGARAADALIAGIQSGAMRLETFDRVLGIGEAPARAHGLSSAESIANMSAPMPVKELLPAMSQRALHRMDKWLADEEFARKATAYYLVGTARLVTAGVPLTF